MDVKWFKLLETRSTKIVKTLSSWFSQRWKEIFNGEKERKVEFLDELPKFGIVIFRSYKSLRVCTYAVTKISRGCIQKIKYLCGRVEKEKKRGKRNVPNEFFGRNLILISFEFLSCLLL